MVLIKINKVTCKQSDLSTLHFVYFMNQAGTSSVSTFLLLHCFMHISIFSYLAITSSRLHNNGVCQAKIFPGEPVYFNKEVHFFNDPNRYNAGIDFYSKRFEHCLETHPMILDDTPNYFIEASKVYNIYTDEKAGNALAK